MKNLKRVLSLGLASVMLLGMMVVGASAKDFTDAEDIVHTEAVQTMVALKIINGKEDGSTFAPKDNVTRAEMAKMIAVLMNGGSEANTGVKTTPTFTDIKGHWAEGWIEYCADMQIINGRGDGTFDPNGQVTGTEALKMVLTALGYNAEAYNLIGAGWAAQTMERARATQPVKLVEALSDVVMTAPATRDTAAQMIWNGLQANAVTTTPDQNKSNGEITWSYGSAGATLLKQRYDADIFTGIFEGNWNSGKGGEKGEITVTPAKADGTPDTGKSVKVVSDLSIDNIGEEVKVVWKDNTIKGNKGTLDPKDTIYGVFNTGATRVIRTQLSKVKDNTDGKDILNIDGTKYDALANVEVITNFDVAGKTTATATGDKGTAGTLAKLLKVNSGYPVKVTFDENGKVNVVYVTESYIGVVTSTNSTNIVVSGDAPCNLKIADHDVEEGLERGDVVVVTPYYTTDPNKDDEKVVVSVKKAEKVSGELVSGKKDETLTLDNGKSYKINYQNKGTKYRLLQTSIPGLEGIQVKAFPFDDDNKYIGEEFDLYLVNGYVMAAVQTSESASNYSVITEVKEGTAGATFGGLQLQVMGVDGTKEIITVSKDSSVYDEENSQSLTHDASRNDSKNITEADYAIGDIITYTFDSDDNAKVSIRAKVASATTVSYDDKAKSLTVDSGEKVVTASDCVIFVQTAKDVTWTPVTDLKKADAKWKAFNIRELDGEDWSADLACYYKNSNGQVEAIFANLKNTPKGASDETVYAIIKSYDRKEKDYYVYTAQSNGEEYTLKVEGDNKDTLKANWLVKFNPTANDVYGKDDVVKMGTAASLESGESWKLGYVKEYNDNDRLLTLWVGEPKKENGAWIFESSNAANTYALDKDAQIIFVDKDKKTSAGESSIGSYTQMDADTKSARKQVGYVLDGDDVIQVLFVETSGKVDVNLEK